MRDGPIEGAALSAILGAEEVREAAGPFRRVLVRVPEAYLLTADLDASRPGFLVLDADGRRVDALCLRGAISGELTAVDIARWLREALKRPALERLVISTPEKGGGYPAFLSWLRTAEGVEKLSEAADVVTLRVRAGALPPATVEHRARLHDLDISIVEPWPVVMRPRTEESGALPGGLCAKVPGCWYASGGRAFVTRLLLDPETLLTAAPGHEPSVRSGTFRFRRQQSGLRRVSSVATLRKHEGVISVFLDLDAGKVLVVARRSRASWDEVVEAFRKAGLSIE